MLWKAFPVLNSLTIAILLEWHEDYKYSIYTPLVLLSGWAWQHEMVFIGKAVRGDVERRRCWGSRLAVFQDAGLIASLFPDARPWASAGASIPHTHSLLASLHTHTLLHLEERLHVTSCTRTAFPFRIIHSSDSALLHCQGFETCLFLKEVWTVFAFKIQTRPNSPTYTTPLPEVCTRRSLWVCRRRVETTSSERLPALQLHWWIIILHTSPEQI